MMMHVRRSAWLLLATCCLAGLLRSLPAQADPATSAPAPLIPREVLFGNPERTQPSISPDGTQIAYLAPVNGVMNVWVRSLEGGDDRAVTADTKRGIQFYLWQYDGRHLLHLQDRDGNENWHLYQTDVAAKTTRDLTPFDHVRVEVVGYEPQHPHTIVVAMNRRDPRVFDVHRIDLESGKVILDTQNPGDVAHWVADHQLVPRIAQVETKDSGMLVRVRDDAKAPWRDLMAWGPDETFGGVVGFTPDGRSVWVETSIDANASRLLEVDLASGRRKVIVEDPEFDVGGVVTHPRTHALEASWMIRQRLEWVILDPSLKEDFEALRRVRDSDVVGLTRSLDNQRWIVTYVSDNAPVYWYLYDRPTRKATLLFSDRPQLGKYRLASMKPIEFTARDGMKLYGYLTTPAGVKAEKLPMVVFVHGGPWGRDRWGFNRYAQWLSNRGYAVLQINFRGSTGYGKKYVNAGDRQWAGAMRTDLLDGKDWAVRTGVADPAKVCIMGGSYGGYATLAGVAWAPDAYACGVDIVGPSNLNTLLKTIPPYWSTILAAFHKRMGDTEAFLTSQSPLFRADQIRVPLLIGQGANDPRVNRAESDQMVAALRKRGKTVEYYVFPDEGHGFARPPNNKAFHAAAERFLSRHLGGRCEPPTADDAKLLESVKQ